MQNVNCLEAGDFQKKTGTGTGLRCPGDGLNSGASGTLDGVAGGGGDGRGRGVAEQVLQVLPLLLLHLEQHTAAIEKDLNSIPITIFLGHSPKACHCDKIDGT